MVLDWNLFGRATRPQSKFGGVLGDEIFQSRMNTLSCISESRVRIMPIAWGYTSQVSQVMACRPISTISSRRRFPRCRQPTVALRQKDLLAYSPSTTKPVTSSPQRWGDWKLRLVLGHDIRNMSRLLQLVRDEIRCFEAELLLQLQKCGMSDLPASNLLETKNLFEEEKSSIKVAWYEYNHGTCCSFIYV